MKNKKKKLIEILKKHYYLVVLIIVAILAFTSTAIIANQLSNEEKQILEILESAKDDFKNPDSLKLVYAKVCDSNYSILRVTANNSFGAETTTTYYANKKTLNTSNEVAQTIISSCLESELKDYNSIKYLSDPSIEKINSRLGDE